MGQEASDPATEPTPAAAAPTEAEADQDNNDGSEQPGCPICQFLEAGPCGDEHKVWVACRQEAKNDGVDFVQHCGGLFRTFFGCMLAHQDYYQPFLEAFQVDVDGSQEAIDKAKDREQQHSAYPGEAANRKQQALSEGPAQQEQQQEQATAAAQQQGSASTGTGVGSIAPAAQ